MTQEQPEKRERLSGVFSSQEVKKVGTGTTTRRTIQKAFWYCNEMDGGDIEVQPLNSNYIPSGPKKTVSHEQFLQSFSPEPEMYVSTVYPKMREMNKTIARADRHRNNKEYYSAEMEYGNALRVDEENVRANFGLGITYLERGDTSKADNIFERLVKLDAAFEPEHKHLFNEFGINLRKNGMNDQALSYYNRAMELASQDENLHYNMARAYLEKKDIPSALSSLLKSLEINPTFDVAAKFLAWLVAKNLVPAEKKADVAAILQKIKTARDAAPAAEGSAAGSGAAAPQPPAAGAPTVTTPTVTAPAQAEPAAVTPAVPKSPAPAAAPAPKAPTVSTPTVTAPAQAAPAAVTPAAPKSPVPAAPAHSAPASPATAPAMAPAAGPVAPAAAPAVPAAGDAPPPAAPLDLDDDEPDWDTAF